MTLADVVESCYIVKARAIHFEGEGPAATVNMLVESSMGTWHIDRTIGQFQHFAALGDEMCSLEGIRGFPKAPAPAERHTASAVYRYLAWTRRRPDRLQRRANAFLQQLFTLPPFIVRSAYFITFFLPTTPPKELPRAGLCPTLPAPPAGHHGAASAASAPSGASEGAARIKVKAQGDIVAVAYEPSAGLDAFVGAALDKLSVAPSRAAADTFTYVDGEGHPIAVRDAEDLHSAVAVFGRRLLLLA